MTFIQAQKVIQEYGTPPALVRAVKGVDITFDQGEFCAVMGPSGSGKSTLLSVLGGLLTPTSGGLVVDDIDVYALSRDRRSDFRREYLGFVFQSFHLVDFLTLAENVMLPLVTTGLTRADKESLAQEALERVGLAGLGSRLPSQASGGEQERAAMARAIVNRPPIILADEPTGNLDSKTGQAVMELLADLNSDGATVIMVTHSEDCAAFAERVIRLADGLVVEEDRRLRAAVG